MKKSISLLLATLFCVPFGGVLTACGGESATSSPVTSESTPNESEPEASSPAESEPDISLPEISAPDDGEAPIITEEEWNAAIAPISFENYTMLTSGYIIQDDGTEMQQDQVVKVTADRMTVALTVVMEKMLGQPVENPETQNIFFDFYKNPEELAMQKNSQEQVFLALLADYNKFVWDQDKQAFVNSGTVTVEIPMQSYASSVSVVMENATLYITEEGQIKCFVCDYTQTTKMAENTIVSSVKNFSWTFSDYGTTVITDETEE